jgi:hypothetical protein
MCSLIPDLVLLSGREVCHERALTAHDQHSARASRDSFIGLHVQRGQAVGSRRVLELIEFQF